ncbi:hypothetical protein ACFSC3_00600 [Sphingomonas floccifaciens]|uniref:Uncharacterized protein n=1 Tax=Sphingomonas floccifaciens TaxID=1844115 RepID=A0ABW4N7Q3_9SPHN
MILAALLMLQAAAPAIDDAAAIGQRLSTWRGTLKDGVCKTRKTTGDAEVDRIGCSAMERCTPQFESRYAGAQDRAIRPEVKKVMIAALNGELTKCVDSERKAGIAALVAKRGA